MQNCGAAFGGEFAFCIGLKAGGAARADVGIRPYGEGRSVSKGVGANAHIGPEGGRQRRGRNEERIATASVRTGSQ